MRRTGAGRLAPIGGGAVLVLTAESWGLRGSGCGGGSGRRNGWPAASTAGGFGGRCRCLGERFERRVLVLARVEQAGAEVVVRAVGVEAEAPVMDDAAQLELQLDRLQGGGRAVRGGAPFRSPAPSPRRPRRWWRRAPPSSHAETPPPVTECHYSPSGHCPAAARPGASSRPAATPGQGWRRARRGRRKAPGAGGAGGRLGRVWWSGHGGASLDVIGLAIMS